MPPLGVRPGAIGFRPPPPRREAAAYHAPLVYAPRPPATSFHAGIPASHPFAGAVQQANRRVAALPQQAAPKPSWQRARENAQLAAKIRQSEADVGLRALEGRAHVLGVPMDVVNPRRGELPGGWIRTPQGLATALRGVAGHEAFQRQGAESLMREAQERAKPHGLAGAMLSLAQIKLPPEVTAAIATGLGAAGVPFAKTLAKLPNEALDLPGQTFLSGAQAGLALHEGIGKGNWAPAHGLAEAILHTFTHPVQSAQQSPLATALMFGGAEAGAGSLIGRFGRAASGGRIFSRAAPDIALYGEGDLVPRGEGEGFVHGQLAGKEGLRITNRVRSPDPLRAALEGQLDRYRFGKATPLRPGEAPAFQARGAQLQKLAAGGRFKVGAADVAHGAEQRRRVAIVRGDVNRVMKRQGTAKDGTVTGVRPKLGADAVSMIGENLLHPHTFVADLKGELERYKAQAKATDANGNATLVGPDRVANKASIDLLEGLLGDKKLLEHVAAKGWDSEPFRAAERMKQLKGPREAMLVHGRKLLPEQLRSAVFSYALSKMGAKYHTIEDHVAAEKTAAGRGESLDRQIEVSGRDPAGTHLHNEAQDRLAQRAQDLKQAELEVRRAENARSRVVGAERVRPADRAPTPADVRASAGGGTAKDAAEGRLQGAKERLATARAAHRQATEDLAAAPLPERNPGLRGPHGEYLDTQTVLDHMAERGHTPPTYFSHVRGVAGRSSFYRAVSRQPRLESFARTGEAHMKGLNDKSWEAAVGTVAKQASEAAQLELRRSFFNRFSMDSFRTAHLAHRAISNFEASAEGKALTNSENGLGKLRAVHYGSGQIVESPAFRDAVHPADVESALHQFNLAKHTDVTHHELGHFGVIPEHIHDRFLAHDEAMTAKGGAMGDSKRAFQAYARAWRRAKLNTSMPHIFGVAQEQAIRVLAEQVGPMAWATGRKYDRGLKRLAEVDKHGFMAERAGPLGEAFRYQEAAMGGHGAVAGSGRWNDIVRKGEQAQGLGTEAKLMRAGERTARSKGGRAILAVWHGWTHAIEDGLLRSLEEGAHHAHLGKALRETGVIDSYRQVLKAQNDAMKALVEDRLTPNAADAVARKVNDMYGNWTQQTPFVRGFVGKYAPFGLWYLNSLRWLYRLPLSHPVKAGVLASLYKATAPTRAAEGQGIDTAEAGKKPVPAFLQGSIPVNLPLLGKVKAVPSYYSPMGALGAEAGVTASDQLLPFLSSPLAALKGVSSLTREPLKGPHGEDISTLQAIENALVEAAAGPVPLSTQLQTYLQRGGKPYGTANLLTSALARAGVGAPTVKPGTEHSLPEVLGKMISPVRVIRPKAETGEVSPAQAHAEEADAIKKALRGPSKQEEAEAHQEEAEAIKKALAGG